MTRAALLCVVALATQAAAAPPALTSADGRFSVTPKRVTAGGGSVGDARHRLDAAFGQPEASTVVSGGRFTATLGVQRRAVQREAYVFRDGFE